MNSNGSIENALGCLLVTRFKNRGLPNGILSTSISETRTNAQSKSGNSDLQRWPRSHQNKHSGGKTTLPVAVAHHVGTPRPDVRSANQQTMPYQATTRACPIRPFQWARHGGQYRGRGQTGRQNSHRRQTRELRGVRSLQYGKRKPTVGCC